MPARAFHAVPNAIYCSLHWQGLQLSTTGVYWIVGAKSPAALPTLADVTAVATIAEAWLIGGAGPKPLIANTATCDFIRAWSQAEEGGPEVTLFEALAGAGPANDNSSEAALCKMETGVHARGVNGRLFFGPIEEGAILASGLLDPAYATSVGTSIADLLAHLADGGYAPSVISQKYGICRPILSVAVGQAVALQSRRMAGRD